MCYSSSCMLCWLEALISMITRPVLLEKKVLVRTILGLFSLSSFENDGTHSKGSAYKCCTLMMMRSFEASTVACIRLEAAWAVQLLLGEAQTVILHLPGFLAQPFGFRKNHLHPLFHMIFLDSGWIGGPVVGPKYTWEIWQINSH